VALGLKIINTIAKIVSKSGQMTVKLGNFT
jgi:hypothetical protein